MTATRQLSFDLGDGTERGIQLGSTIQRRGVIEENGIYYPRATEAYLKITPGVTITIPTGGFDLMFFAPGDTDNDLSYVGDDIFYNPSVVPLLILPYAGVPSVYKVHARLDFSFSSPPASFGSIILEVTVEDTNGNRSTKSTRASNLTQFDNTLEIDFIAELSQVVRVVVANSSGATLILSGSPLPSKLYMDVLYLGAN